MGNDQSSQLKNLEINKKAVEVTDFWSLFNAEVVGENYPRLVSIFQSETITTGQLWANENPLERSIKNLKIYRHPNILKYITSWNRGSLLLLATERCRPLSLNLNTQTDIQICLGLRGVLSALIFLAETAKLRHLNVCSSSIFICEDGSWKLGLEYVWKASEINKSMLEKSQHYRYTKAIDPGEIKSQGSNLEQFAFAVLSEEILRNRSDAALHVNEFKSYCETHLKHKQVSLRPTLSAILLHPYFNHDFIAIHSFLTELPLKNQQAKQEFFDNLIDRLREFDEYVVATQLVEMLLSRMVLLDETAQMCVTPYVLRPQSDGTFPGLFSPEVFVKHIIPKVKQIYSVRDVQIRLILLEHFNQYVHFFTKDEIVSDILPQLLLGIKDTNDMLVSKTLLCLADLIPLIGGNAVIGANRSRIFADGRPQFIPNTSDHNAPRSITPVLNSTDFLSPSPPLTNANCSDCSDSKSLSNTVNFLSELRPEPDGGEADDFRLALTVLASETEQEFGDWSDWENELNDNANQVVSGDQQENEEDHVELLETSHNLLTGEPPSLQRLVSFTKEKLIDNIDAFDITVQPLSSKESGELDFFRDMEPVIQKTSVLVVDEPQTTTAVETLVDPLRDVPVVDKKRFEMAAADAGDESGWNDDGNDWGDDN